MKPQAVEDRTQALVETLAGRRRLLVLTHRNPDPDSLAAAVGLRHLAWETHRLPADLGLSGRIMRAENQAMVKCLGIELIPHRDLRHSIYDCVAVVDTQPGFGHTDLPEGLSVDIVIDHHVPPTATTGPEPRFRDVRTGIGATSSMVAGYLMDLELDVPPDVATALFYGIKTDTADLSRNAGPLDTKAYYFLIQKVDRRKLVEITNPRLPLQYYRVLRNALNNMRIFGHVVLCSLGKVGSPEMVAEVADLFARLENATAVFCGGLVGQKYYVSVRNENAGRDAYELIRGALGGEGSFGGHGAVAGGSIDLPDDSPRMLKRIERRLERNILATMGVEDKSPASLGD